MKKLVEKEAFDRVILVSGDGDYWRMVDYLIKSIMNEPAVSTFGLECRDWNVEPAQQILVKLTNRNEA